MTAWANKHKHVALEELLVYKKKIPVMKRNYFAARLRYFSYIVLPISVSTYAPSNFCFLPRLVSALFCLAWLGFALLTKF